MFKVTGSGLHSDNTTGMVLYKEWVVRATTQDMGHTVLVNNKELIVVEGLPCTTHLAHVVHTLLHAASYICSYNYDDDMRVSLRV